MARIHIARAVGSEGFSRLVAAKRLHPALAMDGEFVKMFLDEARVASKVRHRNVVPVIDVVNIDGEVIMVQELVHGVPLHKLCGRAQEVRNWLPIPISISIATQALAGLHAAHEAVDESGASLNIVHRDVSPQNVMIATDGTARLLDFGVAKTAAAAHITRAGTFKGKLAYSAPEQLRGTVTRQSDIYALGVMLWELLVGRRLHAGRSDEELRKAISQTTPPPLIQALAKKRAGGEIDNVAWRQLEALEPILLRACAYDPAKRYATAAEMENALCAAVKPAPLSEVAAWLRELVGDLLDETDRLIADEEASWRSSQSMPSANPPPTLESEPNLSGFESEVANARTKPWHGRAPAAEARDAKSNQPATRARGVLVAFLAALVAALASIMLVLHVLPNAEQATVAAPVTSSTVTPAPTPPPVPTAPLGGGAPLAQTGSAVVPAPVVEPAPVEPAPVEPPPVAPVEPPPPADSAATTETKAEPPVATITEPAPPKAPAAKRKTVVRKSVKKAAPKPAPAAAKPATTKPADCSTPFYFEGNKKIFKKKCL